MDIPLRLYTKEVLDLVGVGYNTWKKMQNEGKAPSHAYKGKHGNVYLGKDISRFFGLGHDTEEENDPFMKGLKKLG